MTDKKTTGARRSVGAFDIRNVIGALMGLYGVVLLLCAAFLDPGVNPDTGADKFASYNVWTGVALVVVALVFFAWAKLRPIAVPADDPAAAGAAAGGTPKGA